MFIGVILNRRTDGHAKPLQVIQIQTDKFSVPASTQSRCSFEVVSWYKKNQNVLVSNLHYLMKRILS